MRTSEGCQVNRHLAGRPAGQARVAVDISANQPLPWSRDREVRR
jgi:hypothetical protein